MENENLKDLVYESIQKINDNEFISKVAYKNLIPVEEFENKRFFNCQNNVNDWSVLEVNTTFKKKLGDVDLDIVLEYENLHSTKQKKYKVFASFTLNYDVKTGFLDSQSLKLIRSNCKI